MTDRYLLVFDGGSKGNPGPAYGSFHIRPWRDDDEGTTERLNFGLGTNNEAEYLSLIGGLRSLRAYLHGREADLGKTELELRGDSQLVMRQLQGKWKAKDERMRALRDEARGLLRGFRKVKFVEQPRQESVDLLGH